MPLKIERKIAKTKKNLACLKGGIVEAGWFSQTGKHTKSNLTLPQLAAILSYGAKLKGGQPYFFDKQGNLVFMKKKTDGTKPKGAMGITKPSYIPPRPMLAQAAQINMGKWQAQARRLAKGVLRGEATMQEGLGQLGAVIAESIKDTIYHGAFAANSQLTAKRKGKNTPLVDTHELANAVTFKAREGKV